MKDNNVITVAGGAADAVSRRTSLLTLGGAVVTAATLRPAKAESRASRKNAAKNAAKRCARQTGQCRAVIAEHCAPLEMPEVCEAFLSPCCERLAQCNAGDAITCLLTIVAS